MKVLKKFLLIGLFSFVFCITTKAYTNEDFPDVSSFVDTSNYAFNYNIVAKRIDVVYCKNDAVLGTQYVLGGNLVGGSQYKCSSGAYYMRRLYKNGSLFNDWSLEDLKNEVYNFNSSEYSWGSELSSSNNYGSSVLYNNEEERLYILSDMNDSVGVIYTPNNIYYNDFINPILEKDIFGASFNEIDSYKNSEVITYKIKDEDVGQDKELKIKFIFDNVLDVTREDIDIYKYGSQVATLYNLNCSNIETSSVCEFDLKYDVNETIDDKLMFDFKFNNSYNVKIEDTCGSNGVYSNYKDVEYEYKQINFKDKSGAVFYLRNYDNYEYLSSFYEDDYFKFIIMSDTGILGKNKIYPNDIQYKNDYIYKNDNGYIFNPGNELTLNNFGRIEIPFILNSNDLLDNKFSSFILENRNYLGSFDSDNLNLYVYYNSSLFNLNYLKYSSVIKEDGTKVDVFTFSNDYDFTYNGKQESTSSDINNYIEFEFDEDIKVSYNNGFEYFKDKIIDVFELVSDFFNTMPQKFKIAFSFIFVLLIGIALFRLLL